MDDLTTRLLAAIEETELDAKGSVLRRCAADRKIVELHARELNGGYVDCRICCTPYEREAEAWPCDTIKALADGYGITEEDDHHV